MYNKEVKSKYISFALSISASQNLLLYERGLVNRFNRSSSIEEEFGKDILDFTPNETVLFLRKFLKGGRDYQSATISMLKTYCDWGIDNGLSPFKENSFKGIKASDIDISTSYADSMLKDEDDLIACLNSIFPDMTLDTVSNLFRCALLLVFWGIDKDDVWYLKESDINLKTKTIFYKSSEIQMSDNLYETVSYLMNMEKIMKDGKSSDYGIDIVKQGYLISNSKEYNSVEDRKKMRATYIVYLSKILSDCEKSLTNTTISDSGVFYRMYLKEKKTGDVDCLEYLRARRTQPATINNPDRVKEKCKHEYNTWKKAFNL